MNMTTQTKSRFDVKRRATFTVDHLKGKLTFAYPIKGPGTYRDVGNQIDNDKLYRPTTAEIISLMYAAFKSKDNKYKYTQEILKILDGRYFWCFTRNLWTSKGVFVVDDKNGSSLNKPDLEKRLEQNDSSVRFVHNGFRLGEQSSKEFENNPFVIAHAGKEGAKKLAEICSSSSSRDEPFIHGFKDVTEGTERVTYPVFDWVGNRLLFVDYYFGDFRHVYAFGVQK